MKIWKILSGVLTLVFSYRVMRYANASSTYINYYEIRGDYSALGGLFVSLLFFVGGIVSICTCNLKKNGGNIALIILFGIGAIISYTTFMGVFADLVIWGTWSLACAVVALVSYFNIKKALRKNNIDECHVNGDSLSNKQ